MYLLVEGLGISKHSVEGRININSDNSTTETSDIGELVEVVQRNVECLLSSP